MIEQRDEHRELHARLEAAEIRAVKAERELESFQLRQRLGELGDVGGDLEAARSKAEARSDELFEEKRALLRRIEDLEVELRHQRDYARQANETCVRAQNELTVYTQDPTSRSPREQALLMQLGATQSQLHEAQAQLRSQYVSIEQATGMHPDKVRAEYERTKRLAALGEQIEREDQLADGEALALSKDNKKSL